MQRQTPDGAGRDGQHLLRDDHGRGRPGRRPRPSADSACSTPTCRARARWWSTSTAASCSSASCASDASSRPSRSTELERAHARRPAHGLRRRARPRRRSTRYMWAVKGHYFTPFYNWPYTFGLLFGIGLYARYRDDPDRFRAGYDDLLSSTGLDDAAGLAGRFGIDVRSSDFWSSSLDVLRARIDAFEALVGDGRERPRRDRSRSGRSRRRRRGRPRPAVAGRGHERPRRPHGQGRGHRARGHGAPHPRPSRGGRARARPARSTPPISSSTCGRPAPACG